MTKESKKITGAAVELFFPRRCPVCFDIVKPRGELICPKCAKSLVPVRNPVCKKCGKPVMNQETEYCFDCVRRHRTFEYNMAVFEYNDCASRSMSAIKYKNKREYLDFYTEAAWYRFKDRIAAVAPELIVPVPVHPARERERGFNQASVLSHGLSRKLPLSVCDNALKRVKKTAPQKELDPSGRLRNLEQAFAPGVISAGIKKVLLVDDIYTTGSTLEACTRVLKHMGVQKVWTLTLFIGGGA